MSITNVDIINEWSNLPSSLIENFGEEGDFSRQHLLNPTLLSLMGDLVGKKVLDAGCGQGYLSRMLSKKGAKVVGIEPAEPLINYAMEREQKERLGVEYTVEDLSVWRAQQQDFDVCVANMVFMDIPTYKAAMRNCVDALNSGGVFIYSILHPCFEESVDWSVKQSVETKEYFEEYVVPQTFGHFFHRKLSDYINFTLELGCSLQRVVEPQLSREVALETKRNERNLHIPSFIVIKAIKT